MAIITKTFYVCDECNREFEEKYKKNYHAHIKQHDYERKMLEKITNGETFDEALNAFYTLLHDNITDVDKLVEDIKKVDISNAGYLYVKNKNLKYIKEKLTDMQHLINSKFNIDRVELKKSYDHFYCSIRLHSDKPYTNLITSYNDKNMNMFVKLIGCYKNSWMNDYSRIMLEYDLGDITSRPDIEKIYKSKYIKAKLKSSSKKFNKNRYRLDS